MRCVHASMLVVHVLSLLSEIVRRPPQIAQQVLRFHVAAILPNDECCHTGDMRGGLTRAAHPAESAREAAEGQIAGHLPDETCASRSRAHHGDRTAASEHSARLVRRIQ